MKSPSFIISILFAGVKASCYNEEGGEPIADCVCHETCATCGYYAEPTYSDECITCAEGQGFELFPVYDDGTGSCRVPGPELCYENEGDETPIEGCKCHNTCGTGGCGYNDEPTWDSECIDCAEGLEFVEYWSDGSGYCLEP